MLHDVDDDHKMSCSMLCVSVGDQVMLFYVVRECMWSSDEGIKWWWWCIMAREKIGMSARILKQADEFLGNGLLEGDEGVRWQSAVLGLGRQ